MSVQFFFSWRNVDNAIYIYLITRAKYLNYLTNTKLTAILAVSCKMWFVATKTPAEILSYNRSCRGEYFPLLTPLFIFEQWEDLLKLMRSAAH